MSKIKSNYRRLMRVHNWTLLLLEILFFSIFILLIIPLLSVSTDYVLRLWGHSYITMQNVVSFLIYPPSILLILLFVLFVMLFVYVKLTTHLQYCCFEPMSKRPNFPRILMLGFIKAFREIFRGNIALPVYTLIIYIFTNIPILIGITLQLEFPVTLIRTSSDTLFVKGLILLTLVLISFIAFRGIFTLHFCISEQEGFEKGLKHSKALLKGHALKTGFLLFFFNTGLVICFYILYNAVLFFMALLVYLFAEKGMAITIFLSIYPRINIYVSLFFSIVCFVTNFNIISTLFQRYWLKSSKNAASLAISEEAEQNPFQSKNQKKFVAVIMVFIVAISLVNFYLTVQNDSFNLSEALGGIQISSHRGNSYNTPENTLISLESAIESQSDYAEIDIQQTKDGVLILLHDKSLFRTTGLNKGAWELTFDEIKTLDAGSWFRKEFNGTTIPSLEEVLELCKGRIQLNIDIKIQGHETNLEETLVNIIEKYDFEHQCIISSWNTKTLQKIKELNSEIKTGYIVSAIYGDYYTKDYIDFISMRSSFISKSVVESVHSAGKEIHAWTVNSESELERMKSLGVDSIITDNPILAMEVLFRNDANENIIEMLNKMLVNRSFYQLVKNRK